MNFTEGIRICIIIQTDLFTYETTHNLASVQYVDTYFTSYTSFQNHIYFAGHKRSAAATSGKSENDINVIAILPAHRPTRQLAVASLSYATNVTDL